MNYNQKIQMILYDFAQKHGDVYLVVKHYAQKNEYNQDIFKRYGERAEIWKSIKQDSDIYKYLEKIQKMVSDNEITVELSTSDDYFNAYIDISNAIIAIEKSGKCRSQIGVIDNKLSELEMSEVKDVLCKAGMVLERIEDKGTHLPLE